MKRLLWRIWNASPVKTAVVLFAGMLVFSAVALAAAYTGGLFSGGPIDLPIYAKGGLFVGSGATANTLNRISTVKTCTLVYDFPSIPATGAGSGCQVSAWAAGGNGFGTACTGVVFGDRLLLGIDQVSPNTFNSNVPTPIVTAADAVKVQVCNDSNDGGAVDWPDASYTITWIH